MDHGGLPKGLMSGDCSLETRWMIVAMMTGLQAVPSLFSDYALMANVQPLGHIHGFEFCRCYSVLIFLGPQTPPDFMADGTNPATL
jgi:hypothetical protein